MKEARRLREEQGGLRTRVTISVALVAKAHNVSTAEELAALDVLNLNKLGITHIDNLEVFSQIRELHLSRNRIQRLENIEFLQDLIYLDVSFNGITSTGLHDSFDCIPSSLKSINLTGNPCIKDESLLMLIQDKFPSLGIIIGSYDNIDDFAQDGERQGEDYNVREGNEEEGSNEKDASDDDDKRGGNDDAEMETARNGVALDADSLLKSIVERKCRLQSIIHTFDVEAAVQELNAECSIALASISNRGSVGSQRVFHADAPGRQLVGSLVLAGDAIEAEEGGEDEGDGKEDEQVEEEEEGRAGGNQAATSSVFVVAEGTKGKVVGKGKGRGPDPRRSGISSDPVPGTNKARSGIGASTATGNAVGGTGAGAGAGALTESWRSRIEAFQASSKEATDSSQLFMRSLREKAEKTRRERVGQGQGK